MTSQRLSLREKDYDSATSRLWSFENLKVQNHERRDFSFAELNTDNELWSMRHHIAPVITPPSESIVILPNAPLKVQNRFLTKCLRPRRLFYGENQQDPDNNKTANKWKKENLLLSQVTSGTEEFVLRNKSPKSNNKENQEDSGNKSRNLAKESEEKGFYRIDNFVIGLETSVFAISKVAEYIVLMCSGTSTSQSYTWLETMFELELNGRREETVFSRDILKVQCFPEIFLENWWDVSKI